MLTDFKKILASQKCLQEVRVIRFSQHLRLFSIFYLGGQIVLQVTYVSDFARSTSADILGVTVGDNGELL